MNLHFELIGAAATVSLVLGSIWFLSKYLFCQDEFYIPNRKKHNWKPLKFLSRVSASNFLQGNFIDLTFDFDFRQVIVRSVKFYYPLPLTFSVIVVESVLIPNVLRKLIKYCFARKKLYQVIKN